MSLNSLLLQIFFYALLPGVGAFFVRHKWRSFRKSLMQAVSSEILQYSNENPGDENNIFSYMGSLEALEGKSVMWLKNNQLTVSADLSGSHIYILPQLITMNSLPQETPAYIPWSHISSFEEGFRVFLFGTLKTQGGFRQFLSSGKQSLLAVLSHCRDHDFYKLAIWSGRQRNEYWNALTPWSLVTGILSLLILFFVYYFSGNMRYALFALTGAFLPVLPLLPPGLFFFLYYRKFWLAARKLRAERDLIKLYYEYYINKGLTIPESLSLPEALMGKSVLINSGMAGFSQINVIDVPVLSTSLKTAEAGDIYYIGILQSDKESGKFAIKGDQAYCFESSAFPGHPAVLAAEASVKAKHLEIVSALMFFAGLIINYILALFILAAVLG